MVLCLRALPKPAPFSSGTTPSFRGTVYIALRTPFHFHRVWCSVRYSTLFSVFPSSSSTLARITFDMAGLLFPLYSFDSRPTCSVNCSISETGSLQIPPSSWSCNYSSSESVIFFPVRSHLAPLVSYCIH